MYNLNKETKYQSLIIKINEIKAGQTGSEFSLSELELMAEALEIVRFVGIIFQAKKEKDSDIEQRTPI